MGHYAAEMESTPDPDWKEKEAVRKAKEARKFIVADDWSIMKVGEFDKKHSTIKMKWGTMPMSPYIARHGKKLFDTKQEAYEYRQKELELTIKHYKKHIKHLKELHDLPPPSTD